MPRVQIHCYGCDATVPVATAKSTEDLNRAGWSLAHGETYCRKCAPARVPSPVASADAGDDAAGAGDDGADAGDDGARPGDDLEAFAAAVAASIAGGDHTPERPAAPGRAARVLARIPRPGSGRDDEDGDGDARHLARLRPLAAVVVTALQLPFRRSHAPVTSRSKVSSPTIVLFCIAAALTLSTLGSEHMAIRLPGVLFSFAAGLSWLRDLRSNA
jgi:hypothetical protein